MRIAILTHGVSPFGHEYARAFGELGHEAQILSMSACEPSAHAVKMRLVGPADFRPWECDSRWPYLATILPLRRAVREEEPDILFALYLTSAGVLACLSGHPRVVPSAQGSDVNNRIRSRIWRRVFRWQARRACLFHAVSDPLAEMLRDRVGVPPKKMIVCPVGVDTRRLGLIDPPSRPHTGRILCTRAHQPIYDQATLVRALARLKARGVVFHMTFAHPLKAESTRRLVRQYDVEDRVTFLAAIGWRSCPLCFARRTFMFPRRLATGPASRSWRR